MNYYEDYKLTLVDELVAEASRIDSILYDDATQDFLSPMECNDLEYIHYELNNILGRFDIEEIRYNEAWVEFALNNQDNIPF